MNPMQFTPTSPSGSLLAMPSIANRRGVSDFSSYFDPMTPAGRSLSQQPQSLGGQGMSLGQEDQDPALALTSMSRDVSALNAEYTFVTSSGEEGDASSANSPSEQEEFYSSTTTTTAAMTPAQAQAYLAAQILSMPTATATAKGTASGHSIASTNSSVSSSSNSGSSTSLTAVAGGVWETGRGSMPSSVPDDDPMGILSMSRGNSNLQAAIDELDSRTSNAQAAAAAQQVFMQRQLSQEAASSAWQDYDAQDYSEDASPKLSRSNSKSNIKTPTSTSRLEYDGSKYAHPAAGVFDANAPSSLQFHYPSPHSHSHSHSHHHPHHHSHSVPPTVPSVVETAQEPDEESMESGEVGTGSLTMDKSFLHTISPGLPSGNPTYSRNNSTNSAVSTTSGQNSPPHGGNQRMLQHTNSGTAGAVHAPHPSSLQQTTLIQQLVQQNAALSPNANPHAAMGAGARRHSDDKFHTSAAAANITSPQGYSSLQQNRALGKSSSADSLSALRGGVVPQTNNLNISTSNLAHGNHLVSPPAGRLQLHPSPVQDALDHAHQHHHSHGHHSSVVSLQQQPSSAGLKQEPHSASSPGLPPTMNPSFGRSFSYDGVQSSLKEQAYFSDSGLAPNGLTAAQQKMLPQMMKNDPYDTLTPRERAAFHAACGMPSSVGNSPRGSISFPAHPSALNAAGATLHGPGPVRGSSSLGDLHRLMMLHAQGTSATNGHHAHSATHLPLCPLGTNATLSQSSSSSGLANLTSHQCGIGAEKIGAYTREERAKRLARYIDKRSRRCFSKRVLYKCRKDFAETRKRIGGRFIKKQNPGCPCADLCIPSCPNYVEPEPDAPVPVPPSEFKQKKTTTTKATKGQKH